MITGMERYRAVVPPRKAHPAMEKASRVPVLDVLKDYFGIIHPADATFKGYCPFGVEHPDGGTEKAMRTYPATNSAYCFALHGALDPIKLVMLKKGLPARAAAREVLRFYNIPVHTPWRRRYEELLVESEHSTLANPVDLVEAAHLAMSSHPNYVDFMFTQALTNLMEYRLAVLDEMQAVTESAARQWLDETVELARREMSTG